MSVKVKVDERGRIVIPKEIREELGIKVGSELLLDVSGDKIIVKKKYDPFKKLASILGELIFDRSIRRIAEEQALKELKERRSCYVS